MPADEKNLEKYAAKEAEKRGIWAIKLARLAGGGWPDHTFFKRGRVGFIEYKRTEKSKFQPLQKYYLKKLNDFGFMTKVCWKRSQVDEFLEEFDGPEV